MEKLVQWTISNPLFAMHTIYKTYKRPNPTLSDFQEILEENNELKDYVKVLYTWTGVAIST